MLDLNSHATLFGRCGMAVNFKLMSEKMITNQDFA